MSEKEKHIGEKLAKACEILPDAKREYLIGYAEGVAAMANRVEEGGGADDEDDAQ